MKSNKYKNISKIILLMFIIINSSIVVNADAGPKPSLTIYVINSPNDDYYLDLLVDEKSGFGEFIFDYEERDTKWEHLKLYQYRNDGYRAACVHSKMVHGSLQGTDNEFNSYKHSFGYKVPQEFKVIYEDAQGNIQVSNKIKSNNFFASAVYDYKKNELQRMSKSFIYYHNFNITFSFILRLLLTLIVELIVLRYFKLIKRKTPVILANILTQIYLNVLFVASYYTFLRQYSIIVFLILEISIIFIEYNIYKKFCRYESKNYLLRYTIIANIITALLGYWIAF